MKAEVKEVQDLMKVEKGETIKSLSNKVISLGNLMIKMVNEQEAAQKRINELFAMVQASSDRASTAETKANAAGKTAGRAMASQVARDKAMAEKRSVANDRRVAVACKTIAETIGYDAVEDGDPKKLGKWQWCLSTGEVVSCRRKVEAAGLTEIVKSMLPKHFAASREAVLQATAAAIRSKKGQEVLNCGGDTVKGGGGSVREQAPEYNCEECELLIGCDGVNCLKKEEV